MNPPWVYMCSPSWTPLPLPPHTIPLGRPSAPAPSIQYHALNLGWRFISYMILYMFQCHSPKSSHPHPLPQSPKDFYTSVSLLLSRIQGYRYHLSKFHIYALVETVSDFIFLGSKITTDGDCSHETKRHLFLGRNVMTNLHSILRSRDIPLPAKFRLVKGMVFPVVMYGYESWTIKQAEHQKNWCFWTVVLEKTLGSPLDWKDIKPVNPKGNQQWIFIRKTDAKALILWPPDTNSWLSGKDPDAGEDWWQ